MEKCSLNLVPEVEECLISSKYSSNVTVKVRHCVEEFSHVDWDQEGFDKEQIERHNFIIKNRELYRVPNYIFSFQFYDIFEIWIDGEVLAGKKRRNISPMIFMGKREILEVDDTRQKFSSVIVDLNGVSHDGNKGVTYQEYLENVAREKKIKEDNEMEASCMEKLGKEEMEQQISLSQTRLNKFLNEKENLRIHPTVQRYLTLEEAFEAEKRKQDYLNSLEVGEDNTIFAPVHEQLDRSFCNTHFGLSVLLQYAFDLLQKVNSIDIFCSRQISFSNFYDYVKNAEQVLTKMCYFPGDRLDQNSFGLNVYQNPKNYSVVNLEDLMPITNSQLQNSYHASNIYICEDGFVNWQSEELGDSKKINEKLTPREVEAFYGKGAQLALGILPSRAKEKSKIIEEVKA